MLDYDLSMDTTLPIQLPAPDQVRQRIAAAEDEIKALRRLLRVSNAAVRAEEARLRRTSLESGEGGAPNV
jgi:hypothetical protein